MDRLCGTWDGSMEAFELGPASFDASETARPATVEKPGRMDWVDGFLAWLETGDPYLIETAQAVIDTAYWTHKNSWPRQTIGRDA